MPARKEILEVAGREVAVSNPDKIFFAQLGLTKIDLIRYYLAVAEGALRGAGGRPMALKRFPNGAEQEFFFQKRAPPGPVWIETVELKFPSGRTAQEVVVRDAAQLAWVINLGCIDLNPHPVRASDGGASAAARHQQMVEGGEARCVHRLQPERQGSHGGFGVLGAAYRRCA